MVFSSLIFLWMFLPIVLGMYFLTKESYRNVLLLAASLFFYAWGEPVYVLVMILSIVINYIYGLKIGTEDETKRKRALVGGIVINLALLGVFKYSGFLWKTLMLFSVWKSKSKNCLCRLVFRFIRSSRFLIWWIFTAGFARRRKA